MIKKKRDVSLPKRFNSEDVKKWQEQANLTTGGNLTLWMENALNNAVKKQNVKSKHFRSIGANVLQIGEEAVTIT